MRTVRLTLRRATFKSQRCPVGPELGHVATADAGTTEALYADAMIGKLAPYDVPRDDQRWPTHCQQCGAKLPEYGQWLVQAELAGTQ